MATRDGDGLDSRHSNGSDTDHQANDSVDEDVAGVRDVAGRTHPNPQPRRTVKRKPSTSSKATTPRERRSVSRMSMSPCTTPGDSTFAGLVGPISRRPLPNAPMPIRPATPRRSATSRDPDIHPAIFLSSPPIPPIRVPRAYSRGPPSTTPVPILPASSRGISRTPPVPIQNAPSRGLSIISPVYNPPATSAGSSNSPAGPNTPRSSSGAANATPIPVDLGPLPVDFPYGQEVPGMRGWVWGGPYRRPGSGA